MKILQRVSFLIFFISSVIYATPEIENSYSYEELNKLIASDANASNNFGTSVSISGDYAIVGAYTDNNGSDSGSAYIFKKDDNNNNFTQISKLTASDANTSDYFGTSVSISGDYAIVGAYGDDDNGSLSGSAYIFKKDDNNNFIQISKLTASDANTSDYFGTSVSISGDYAIVGAYGDDDNGSSSGSAYIFKKDDNGNFTQISKLTASDANASDNFGISVSISGDYTIVGAKGNDDNGSSSGSAYIFKNDNDNFTQISKLTASDADVYDYFGGSVSISGEYAIVGANKNDDNGTNSGSAYIFKKDDNDNFMQISKLTALDANASDYFGSSVSISGDYTIVGASYNDDNGSDSGSVYIFNSIIKTTISENSIIAIDINASNYSISGGADQNLFDINSTTGIVTFKIAPDFENPHDNNRDNLYELYITVSDDSNGVSKNIEISVTNQILKLDSISNVNKIEDANGFSIELNATDNDGDTIVYTAISSDISIATVSISDDNNLTITPLANANGIVRIDVNATANGKSVMKSFDLNITAVNDMPTINSIENITKNENFSDFNVSLIATP